MPRTTHSEAPAEPWRSFLSDLDKLLDQPVDFHCIGGFVVSQYYGFSRETADLDILSVVPQRAAETIFSLAGKSSPLHRKYHVHIDRVGVANYPDSYEDESFAPSRHGRKCGSGLSKLTTWH
jgi:hypothetical protein